MTVSSDILLSGTAAASKAANKNAVSNDKGQQTSDTASVKSSSNSFKDHLAQETNQSKASHKAAPSPEQPAGSVSSKDKPVQNAMSTTAEETTQQIIVPTDPSTKSNIIEGKDMEDDGNSENEQTLLGAENSQGEGKPNSANNVVIAIEGNGQKDTHQQDADITGQPPVATSNTKDNNPLANEDIKTPNVNGANTTQDTKGGQILQNKPILTNTNTAEPIKKETMAQNTLQDQKPTNGLPVMKNPSNSQAAAPMADQAMANMSPKETITEDASPKASSVQKDVPTIVANSTVSSPAMEDTALSQTPLTQAPLIQATTVETTALPTTEQAVLVSAQQVALNDPANEKRLKDGAKEDAKETASKSSYIAASESKKASAAGKKEQGSSQNSASDQNTNKTIAELIQNTTPKGSNQASLLAKVPFVADLSQVLIAGEGKTAQGSGLQLPSGLLSVQEVGQVGQQANSLSATTSQIKHPMPPVTPQMLTKQISMNILKQAQNGQDSFRINLKPAELGQVDIRMDFHTDGKMTATVTVENDRTLALLQRDQGALQKALENAGFDAGGNNLNFSLKKQQQEQAQANLSGNNTEDGDYDDISAAPNSINSHQQMKMAYSDNALDINI